MSEKTALAELIRRARRRLVSNAVFAQGASATSAALGGFVLLLVFGTQVLDWPWLVGLAAVAVAWGAYRVYRAIPSGYSVAQDIDRKLNLQDSLSTAWVFGHGNREWNGSGSLCAAQYARADQMAAKIEPAQAAPLVFPRSFYVTVLLGMLAGSLFALRYGMHGTLDLKPPISQAVFDIFRVPFVEQLLPEKKQARSDTPSWMQERGFSLEDGPEGKRAGAQGSPNDNDSVATEEGQSVERGARSEVSGQTPQEAGTPLQTGSEGSDGKPGEQEGNGGEDGGQPNADRASSQEKQDQGGQQGQQDGNDDSGLMQKMQDAMANLLAKFKMPNLPTTGQQRQAAAGKQVSSGAKEKGEGASQQPGPGESQQEGEPQGDAKGEQSGEGSEQAQGTPGSQGDQSAESRASNESRSGMGKQDGDKTLRETQELQAMGQISEILGKRSETLKGEMTVEVSSGNQQLQTQYSQRQARLAAEGGEIHRDEVPAIHQNYVKKYFEQVRK